MRIKDITPKQWVKFGILSVLYLLFTIWMQNGWLLLGLIVIAYLCLTPFAPWKALKKTNNPTLRSVLDWTEDIVFALVAVYLINIFLFQNYQIPSSSLEKTLLTGDYLFVSKLSYGPRVPNTPLSFPLVQNTFPITNTKSYLEWPQWGYKRVKGLGHVKRDDIVVFNFPAGDTIAFNYQNPDYYTEVQTYSREALYLNKGKYGEIIYRPVDKRENYVKRCIGMPGDSLQIIQNQVYIDGVPTKNPTHIQFNYFVELTSPLNEEQFRVLDISKADRWLVSADGGYSQLLSFLGFEPAASGNFNFIYHFPLTDQALEKIKKLPAFRNAVLEPDIITGGLTYPVDYNTGWTRDNYGPLWIPEKGATIQLTEENLALYHRCIRNYENNELEIRNGQIFINGEETTTYTFKYDYYFMMGDNRHNSADSRSWGFVPEDHVVGKPILVWLSLDPDRSWFDGKIRWNRLFRTVTHLGES